MTGSIVPDQRRASSDGSANIASLSASEYAGIAVASVSGELDISNIDQIAEAISRLPNSGDGLVVDLTAVSYIDSTAVSLLHDLAVRLRQRAQRLIVVALPASPPRRILELTALELIASLADDLESAVTLMRD